MEDIVKKAGAATALYGDRSCFVGICCLGIE